MSAEVILMNKNGIAIAADSAVTIGNKTKIYNTANKMYMLSKYAPVGILIYNNSSLMGIQVELIIKEYRKNLGDKKFDTLKEYSENFLEFCIEFTNKYSGEVSQIELINWQILKRCDTIFKIVLSITNKEIGKNSFKDDNELINFINNKIEEIIDRQTDNVDTEFMDDEYYNNIVTKLDTNNIIKKSAKSYNIFIKDEISEKLINNLNAFIRDKKNWDKSNYIGIAITGYGEEEIFPSCIELETLGIINNNIFKTTENKYQISFQQNSHIIPLAQTDVMNEFFLGVNNEISSMYDKQFRDKINAETEDNLKGKIRELQEVIKKSEEDIVNRRLMNIRTSLSFLPRDEMIYMAEGMINMTSFKRRLVLDSYSQTVGGPIDVAFISKGDGFIWINRKKYFDKEMNYVFSKNYFKKKGE